MATSGQAVVRRKCIQDADKVPGQPPPGFRLQGGRNLPMIRFGQSPGHTGDRVAVAAQGDGQPVRKVVGQAISVLRDGEGAGIHVDGAQSGGPVGARQVVQREIVIRAGEVQIGVRKVTAVIAMIIGLIAC